MSEPMIYTPARRDKVAVLIMLAGPSGSGKTKSALRLATGLAEGGTIGFCDTEHGRASYYADDFDFQHLQLKEPFNPAKFEAAAVVSQKAGHAVWICDSFSHEHVGPGGVLDMQEAELQRMTRGDDSKRDALKYTAWIKPKGEHKHLVQRLWQLNQHIILCCHAEKKLELIKNDKGKTVPNPDAGFSAVCSPDIPYAMTASLLLDPKEPGVPRWLKWFDKLVPFIHTDHVLDEQTGADIAAWARGVRQPQQPSAQSQSGAPLNGGATEPPTTTKEDKSIAIAQELKGLFAKTDSAAAHFAIVDDDVRRKQLEWLKKNRKHLFEQVNAAVVESYRRHQSPTEAPEQGALGSSPPSTDRNHVNGS